MRHFGSQVSWLIDLTNFLHACSAAFNWHLTTQAFAPDFAETGTAGLQMHYTPRGEYRINIDNIPLLQKNVHMFLSLL
jgi:hypothetical protein